MLRERLMGIGVLVTCLLACNAVGIRLFDFKLLTQIRESLFYAWMDPQATPDLMLLNTGTRTPREIIAQVDSLLSFRPKRIGINLCDLGEGESLIRQHFANHPKVVLAACPPGSPGSSSVIVDDRNRVTHFRTDRPDYFESIVAGNPGRGREVERLFYGYPRSAIYRAELNFRTMTDYPSGFGMIVLVGYMGDVLADSIHHFRDTRITPLNPGYDADWILPDMYDIEISAQIVSALREGRYLNEVQGIARVAILILWCAINVLALIYLPVKRIWVDVLVGFLLYFLTMMGASWLIILLFQESIYVSLDELPLMLILLLGSVVLQRTLREKAQT